MSEKVLIEFDMDTTVLDAKIEDLKLRLEYIVALAEKAGIDLSIKSEL
jgi:hypothetical protein